MLNCWCITWRVGFKRLKPSLCVTQLLASSPPTFYHSRSSESHNPCHNKNHNTAIYVERNIEARSRNHFCRRKAVVITYSGCASVASVIQHAKRMRRVILPFVACLDLSCFPHYLKNNTIFGKRVIDFTIWVWIDFLYNFCPKFLHSKKNLIFLWPCIMNWLYINYQLDALIIIYS